MPNQMNDNDQLIRVKSEEKECVEQLKHWLETETKFYGRTDEDFLLIFVRGCKKNMEKAKKKLYMYYENRKKVPQWWANRNLSELKHLLQLKIGTLLPDNDPQLPLIAIIKLSRAPPTSHQLDNVIKVFTVYMDLALRRPISQQNGSVGLIDCSDLPFWVIPHALSPVRVYNFIHGFCMAMPLRIKQVHFFNFSLVGRAVWPIIRSFLSPKLKNRFFVYGSDLSSLQNNIDVRLLPEEYGGRNGRLVDHEEPFLTEIFSYSEYILDDNKYGF